MFYAVGSFYLAICNLITCLYDRIADPAQKENLGIIVQYKVKVKLCITPLGGLVNVSCYLLDIFNDFL